MSANNNATSKKDNFSADTSLSRAFNKPLQAIGVNPDVRRIKIGKKFTTTTTDYDLIQDTTINTILLNYYSADEILKGIDMTVSIFVDTVTEIKINTQDFYNDFLNDIVFDTTQLISKIIIKDTGITGYIEIILND